MNDLSKDIQNAPSQEAGRPQYVTPEVRVMNEAEVLSAYQVTAAATGMWWV